MRPAGRRGPRPAPARAEVLEALRRGLKEPAFAEQPARPGGRRRAARGGRLGPRPGHRALAPGGRSASRRSGRAAPRRWSSWRPTGTARRRRARRRRRRRGPARGLGGGAGRGPGEAAQGLRGEAGARRGAGRGGAAEGRGGAREAAGPGEGGAGRGGPGGGRGGPGPGAGGAGAAGPGQGRGGAGPGPGHRPAGRAAAARRPRPARPRPPGTPPRARRRGWPGRWRGWRRSCAPPRRAAAVARAWPRRPASRPRSSRRRPPPTWLLPVFTGEFYDSLQGWDRRIQRAAVKQAFLLAQDHRHPSLRALPLEGLPGYYRVRVATDVRLIYRRGRGAQDAVEILSVIDREDLDRYVRQAKTSLPGPGARENLRRRHDRIAERTRGEKGERGRA